MLLKDKIDLVGLKLMLFVLLITSGVIKGFFVKYGVTVPYTELVLAFSVILTSLIAAKRKTTLYIGQDGLVLLQLSSLVILFIYILANIFYSPSQEYFFTKLLYFIIIFYIYICSFFMANDFNFNAFVRQLLYLTIIVNCMFLFDYYYSFNNVESFVSGINYLPVGLLNGLSLILVLHESNKKVKALCFVFFLLTLIVSGARGPLVFYVFIMAIYFIFFCKTRLKYSLYIFGFSVIAIMGFLYFGDGVEILKFVFNSTFNRLFLLFSDSKGASVNVRVEHVQHSLEFINQKMFFGSGFASYGLISSGMDIRSYPHNVLLEIWVELGLLGFVLYSLFIGSGFLMSMQLKNKYLFLSLLFLFINALKSSSYAEQKLMFGVLCIISILYLKRDKT
jgi:O-antigen ligase